MSLRTPLIATLTAVVTMLGITAWAWSLVPDGAPVVMHWSITDGRPDGRLPKAVAFLVLPLGTLFLSGVYAAIPRIEPRHANLLASRKLYFAGWYCALAIFTVLHAFLVLNATGIAIDVPRWVLLASALMMAVLGNYLGKSRATFFVGMRSPWSLSSDEAWKTSNRVSGHWLVAAGVVTAVVTLFAGWRQGLVTLVCGAVISAVAGLISSYLVWKRDPHRHTEGREELHPE
ncbi:MAG TPA: SdpI family protein [Rhizomicrobium sp.]|jgi:uncharacterized membrane protein